MPIANCRLPIADCPLPIVNYQLKDLTSLEPGYQWAMGNGQSAIGNRQLAIGNRQCTGGEGGMRTHGTVARTQHFQCCQFNHSCTSPKGKDEVGRMKDEQEAKRRLSYSSVIPHPSSFQSGGEGGI